MVRIDSDGTVSPILDGDRVIGERRRLRQPRLRGTERHRGSGRLPGNRYPTAVATLASVLRSFPDRIVEHVGRLADVGLQMIAVGEESGSLDEMSAKVADFYEEDVDNAVDNLSSLLEPLIMAILGVLVGGLVIAMYLPIFKMGAVV